MKIPFLDLRRQHAPIQEELNNAVWQIMDNGWFIGGDPVARFEKQFANYLGVSHCISCGSGTDALELILRGFGIGRGDEVIIPSFTWVSVAEAVCMVGARPVYADIALEDFGLMEQSVRSKVTAKTKAIIVVHMYGLPSKLALLIELATQYKLKVIEDCAHAHGASFEGKKIGTLGDAAAVSFYPTKNLGALGDGGAVTTQDAELAETIRLMRNHGQRIRDKHEVIGRNSRLDTLQAALLSVKLRYLDQWNEERRRLSRIYFEGLKDLDLILPTDRPGRIFHLFVIRSSKREELRRFLAEEGIETAIHYPIPIHAMDIYRTGDVLPNSEQAAHEVLSLPLYQGLRDEEVEYVAERVKHFV